MPPQTSTFPMLKMRSWKSMQPFLSKIWFERRWLIAGFFNFSTLFLPPWHPPGKIILLFPWWGREVENRSGWRKGARAERGEEDRFCNTVPCAKSSPPARLANQQQGGPGRRFLQNVVRRVRCTPLASPRCYREARSVWDEWLFNRQCAVSRLEVWPVSGYSIDSKQFLGHVLGWNSY